MNKKSLQNALGRIGTYLPLGDILLARLQSDAMAFPRGAASRDTLILLNHGTPEGSIGAANVFTVIQDNWVQVSPAGDFPNVGPVKNGKQQFPGGIVQRIDNQSIQTMVEDFNSIRAKVGRLFGGLPWYIGHPDGDPANWSDKSAYGWIMALENRGAEGLWAQVKWTEQGEKLKESGAFKYFSPFWIAPEKSIFTENGRSVMRPTRLKSVGFVNDPNIPVMPLANAAADAPKIDLVEALSDMSPEDFEALCEKIDKLKLANSGTSEGAKKGWETRRGNAAGKQKAAAKVAAKTRSATKKPGVRKKPTTPANKEGAPKPPPLPKLAATPPPPPKAAAVAAATRSGKPGFLSKLTGKFKTTWGKRQA